MGAEFAPLCNRVRKNRRHLARWARREAIHCYRLYDRDMPEFPFAIDWYDGEAHLQVFHGRRAERFDWDALQRMLADALAIPSDAVVLKTRQRQRGENQYQPTDAAREPRVVGEGGLRFEVELRRYLDTGLFLDHRITRAMVRDEAAGRRVLNLFAYTGSFSVYAAAGGAVSTLSVDLSRTYQEWTRRNLALNGLDSVENRLEQADVFAFLDAAVRARRRFDLIVLDPPSFSNSKRMREVLDVQRDHPRLVRACLELLDAGGVLYFSNNRRRFKLAPELPGMAACEDITRRTTPPDFARIRPHFCWRFVK